MCICTRVSRLQDVTLLCDFGSSEDARGECRTPRHEESHRRLSGLHRYSGEHLPYLPGRSRSLTNTTRQVRFSLTSSAVFTRNDKVTDSERFYRSLLEFLEQPSESKEVDSLLRWWNV